MKKYETKYKELFYLLTFRNQNKFKSKGYFYVSDYLSQFFPIYAGYGHLSLSDFKQPTKTETKQNEKI